METEKEAKTWEATFIERIDELQTGERTALKRSCGVLLNNADIRAFNAFYKALLLKVPAKDEDIWFFAGCVRAQWDSTQRNALPFEKAMADFSKKDGSDSFQKRFVTLLDTPWSEDGYLAVKLTRIIKLLKQKGYVINAESLLRDLRGWNNEDRYVQKKWAKTFNFNVEE